MKNLMILTFLLIFAVGCKSDAVEEVPVKELTDEEIEKIFQLGEYNEKITIDTINDRHLICWGR